MPFEVAPLPVPSWERQKPLVPTLEREVGGSDRMEEAPGSGAPSSAVSPARGLDAAFLCRLHLTIAWFGALSTLLVASSARQSGSKAWLSYLSGLLLSWALLGAQGFLVQRALQPGHRGRRDAKKMLWWLLVPVKYLGVAALIAWMLKGAQLSAGWIALGFGIVQFLMAAKVVGLVLKRQVKTVRQAYVEPGR